MGKRFVKQFEQKVGNTIRRYNLVDKKDRVVVACSGGKDSTTTLYLLKKFGYNVEAMTIDISMGEWSKKNLENIKTLCENNRINLHIVSMRKEFGCSICYIREGIQAKKRMSNCTVCGVTRRWLLNKKAREIKADKIATGHNLDDEAETILMNLIKGNPELSIGLGPKTGILDDKKFVQRVKPLYFCTNKEVRKYSETMNFPVVYEPCPCSTGVLRREVRKGLNELESKIPKIKVNIVQNFLKILPALRKNYKTTKRLKYCKICGEPSRKEVCMRCELISIARSK